MENKQFSVVFFPSDNSVEVVPTNWLSEDKSKCPFPLGKPKGFKKVQENSSSVSDSSWPDWEVSVAKTYDSFSKANRKAQALLKKKSLELSESEDHRDRRPRNEANTNSETFTTQDQPPEGNLFLEGFHVEQLPSSSLSQPSNLELQDERTATGAGSDLQLIQIEDPRVGTLINEFRAFQASSLQNQLVILEELREVKRLALRNSAQPIDGHTVKTFGIFWPLRTEDELQAAEQFLESSANFGKEVQLISRIGGSSVAKVVNNILKFLISHDFALNLRITKQSGKLQFGGTRTAKLVRDSVRKFYEAEESSDPTLKIKTTDDQLDSLVGKWLRDSVGRGKDGQTRRINRNAKIHEAEKDTAGIGDDFAVDPESA